MEIAIIEQMVHSCLWANRHTVMKNLTYLILIFRSCVIRMKKSKVVTFIFIREVYSFPFYIIVICSCLYYLKYDFMERYIKLNDLNSSFITFLKKIIDSLLISFQTFLCFLFQNYKYCWIPTTFSFPHLLHF